MSFSQKSGKFKIKDISNNSQVHKLINLIETISKINPDSALSVLKTAEIISLKSGDEEALMQIYFKRAEILFRQGKNDKAFVLFQKTLSYAEKLNNNYYINASKIYIGTIYLFRADYNLASKYNIEGLAYFEKEKDYKTTAGIYLNLTFIQIAQKDTLKALEYTKKSYNYSIKAKSKIYESKSLMNFGELYIEKKEYAKALLYTKRALKISEENNFYLFIPSIKLNMGGIYSEINKTDSAEICFQYVIKNEKNPYMKSLAFLGYGELYEYKKDYDKAIEFVEKAQKTGNAGKLNEIRQKANASLANLYVLKGDYKKAYEYKLKAERINDSIFSEEKYRVQNELETIYEISEKEKKINELSKEKEISLLKAERFQYGILFLSVILISSVIVSLMVLRHNKSKAENEAANLKQKLLRTQMNPHFIFNSLSSIQDFILSNNSLEASSYLSDFAKLMRAILINSSENFILLSKEIEIIENYLKLQHLRLSEKFEYKIFVSYDIDNEVIMLPPMLLQPFIENSVLHAFKNNNEKGLIKVSFNISDNNLIAETEDNGSGRKKNENIDNQKHQSKSISITRQRIDVLSKIHKQNISFEIIDLKDENNKPSGTLVRFKLPLL